MIRCYLAIDSQNVSYRVLPDIMKHLNTSTRRITTGKVYMDLMNVSQGWITEAIRHGVDPIGVYCHPGKDSLDHYLVSDLLGNHLLQKGCFDEVVLVTNDSDFRKTVLDIKPIVESTRLYCRTNSPKDLTAAFDSVYNYDLLDTNHYNNSNSKKRKRD